MFQILSHKSPAPPSLRYVPGVSDVRVYLAGLPVNEPVSEHVLYEAHPLHGVDLRILLLKHPVKLILFVEAINELVADVVLGASVQQCLLVKECQADDSRLVVILKAR